MDDGRAYLDGLRMLARRELSEAQVWDRLVHKGYAANVIADAIARLREERALDDARVADAIIRRETATSRRGKRGVQLRIERAGVTRATARKAVNDAFAGIDDHALLEAAIVRRLRGRDRAADDRELQRLYRYLVAQGFDVDAVMRALEGRRPGS
jgi:regulatory protein